MRSSITWSALFLAAFIPQIAALAPAPAPAGPSKPTGTAKPAQLLAQPPAAAATGNPIGPSKIVGDNLCDRTTLKNIGYELHATCKDEQNNPKPIKMGMGLCMDYERSNGHLQCIKTAEIPANGEHLYHLWGCDLRLTVPDDTNKQPITIDAPCTANKKPGETRAHRYWSIINLEQCIIYNKKKAAFECVMK